MILNAHAAKTDPGVLRLQTALWALGQKKGDRALLIAVDGVVGPTTVRATTRALGMYVVQGSGVIPQSWIRGTSTSIIKASANDIARYIEQAAGSIPYVPPSTALAPSAIPPQTASMIPSSGGDTMYPQQGYVQRGYPPSGYAPGYAPGYGSRPQVPGGLPPNQASLDVRAFIPAQYDHVQLHPAGGIAIIAIGVLAVMLISQRKKSKA